MGGGGGDMLNINTCRPPDSLLDTNNSIMLG